MSAYLERIFQNLRLNNYSVTSPKTPDYNCIAWAAGETHRRWWPIVPGWYWPEGTPREETIDAFIAAFRLLGYEECQDPSLESDHDKVALYVSAAGTPTHMARQLESGVWTSKLGSLEDISHESLSCVEGPSYGSPVRFLKRKKKS
jgi:hypothetical protein